MIRDEPSLNYHTVHIGTASRFLNFVDLLGGKKCAEVDRAKGSRFTQVITLSIFRATRAQRLKRCKTIDVLADDLERQRLRQLGDGTDHFAVKVAAGHAFDEAAFDSLSGLTSLSFPNASGSLRLCCKTNGAGFTSGHPWLGHVQV